jgi:hypothetical protein
VVDQTTSRQDIAGGLNATASQGGVEALTINRRIYGDVNERVWLNINNLGNLRYEQARMSDAVNVHRDALNMARELFGVSNRTAMALHNLSTELIQLGRLKEASRLADEAHGMANGILGSSHPLTAAIESAIALIYRKTGRLPESVQLYRQVLTKTITMFGERNPNTAMAMRNLAVSLSETRNYDDAVMLVDEALSIQEEVIGEAHPDTIESMQVLGEIASQRGDLANAERLLRNARALCLGTNYTPRSLVVISALAEVLTDRGKFDDAEREWRVYLEGTRRVYGSGSAAANDATEKLKKVRLYLGKRGGT